MTITKTIAGSLALTLLVGSLAFGGLGSKKAEYVGGTVTAIKDGTEGDLSTADEKQLVFNCKAKNLAVPYDRINSLEYGQKAGRRIGVAIAVSPVALLSKKRKHFLTVNFMDENEKQQAAVFELGKDIVRVTLSSLEARTGRKIEYQDDEARKGAKGN